MDGEQTPTELMPTRRPPFPTMIQGQGGELAATVVWQPDAISTWSPAAISGALCGLSWAALPLAPWLSELVPMLLTTIAVHCLYSAIRSRNRRLIVIADFRGLTLLSRDGTAELPWSMIRYVKRGCGSYRRLYLCGSRSASVNLWGRPWRQQRRIYRAVRYMTLARMAGQSRHR